MKKLMAHILFASCVLTVTSVAKADEQITLGRTIVLEASGEGAIIPLLICRKTDALKIKAERKLNLEKVIVTFNNGNTKTVRFYRDLKKNEETKWRSFGYKRCVKKLEVFGSSVGSRAGVKVFGRKD
ncbi:DUF2541 family protein [Shewanella sp. E94]|nr:DUF2541 family protein [Shewanella sp. E94]